MPKIVDLKECSGCHACYSICPQKCIYMKENPEGFLYPEIDEEKCINCSLCEKVCPVIQDKNGNSDICAKAYACYNTNEEVRKKSSSGGIFTLIAEKIIDMGGVVFGAAFDDEFNVVHKYVDNRDDLDELRGSKYVQSTIGSAYVDTKRLLDAGRMVLFTGTPCQIDGLLNFLGKKYDNLYTQDLICHGVASPNVWRKYMEYMKKSENSKIKNVYFRNKKFGWKNFCMQLEFENNVIYTRKHGEDLFVKSFLKNLILRQTCYACRSKTLNRNSDITLADFWGIEYVVPDMNDDKGTSLIMVNSSKGQRLFRRIVGNIIYKEVALEQALVFNSAAYKSVSYNKKRERFFGNLSQKNFKKNVEIYTKTDLWLKIARKIKQILKNVRG